MFCRHYTYWDTVCEKLQGLLDDGIMQKESIFYLYLKNALSFVTDIKDPKLHFQWDPEILQFVESLEYHGHEKNMNLLRGPGFWVLVKEGQTSLIGLLGTGQYQRRLQGKRTVLGTQLTMVSTKFVDQFFGVSRKR